MSLQQGGGRLIRTHDDRGVIAILDSRISRKPWGHAVLACLPDGAPVATSLDDVRAFFSENDVDPVSDRAGNPDDMWIKL